MNTVTCPHCGAPMFDRAVSPHLHMCGAARAAIEAEAEAMRQRHEARRREIHVQRQPLTEAEYDRREGEAVKAAIEAARERAEMRELFGRGGAGSGYIGIGY